MASCAIYPLHLVWTGAGTFPAGHRYQIAVEFYAWMGTATDHVNTAIVGASARVASQLSSELNYFVVT
ncbi:MAG: hypothetical protein L3K19_03400 [Thermoplasmata archaeon]|nr:hypothetical protein [Thermoplasmata archaeon]